MTVARMPLAPDRGGDTVIIRAIATSVAQHVTVKTFAAALRGLVVEELALSLEGPGPLPS